MQGDVAVKEFNRMSHQVALEQLRQLGALVKTLEAEMQGPEWEEFQESRRAQGDSWCGDIYNQIVFARREIDEAQRRIVGEKPNQGTYAPSSNGRVTV
ncbi:MAG TPA: hypothetical protein VIH52_04500 [Candidatus Nanoarchaeia archaeon]